MPNKSKQDVRRGMQKQPGKTFRETRNEPAVPKAKQPPIADPKGWIWSIDLEPMVGRNAFVETHDGVLREGRISGVEWKDLAMKDLRLGEIMVRIPMHIELNGDPQDQVEFSRMKRFELR